MRKIILIQIILWMFSIPVGAGPKKFSRLDKIGNWIIERSIDSSSGAVSCRASIPGFYTWFGGRIRLNNNGELLVPKEIRPKELPSPFMLAKVRSALELCNESIVYLQDE